jgi:hypothetical protein
MSLRSRLPRPITVVAIMVGTFVASVGLPAGAATGGNFVLGNPNDATTETKLTTPLAGAALHVANLSTGTGATALKLDTAAGKPGLQVSNTTKIAKLNADLVDGLDSTQLQRPLTGSCSSGFALQATTQAGGLTCTNTVAGASSLGGVPASGYMLGTGRVAGAAVAIPKNSGGVGHDHQHLERPDARIQLPGRPLDERRPGVRQQQR